MPTCRSAIRRAIVPAVLGFGLEGPAVDFDGQALAYLDLLLFGMVTGSWDGFLETLTRGLLEAGAELERSSEAWSHSDSAYDRPMTNPQPGIFAQGTRSHYHLEFDLRPDVSDANICAAVGRLREPSVTVGGSNIVVGFGPGVWQRLNRDDAPDNLFPFVDVEGGGGRAPATQHDVWVWSHGTGEDVQLDVARGVAGAFAPVATLAQEQPGFVYRDGRDLTGFIDGTENPPVEEAHDVAIVSNGEKGEGGAHVIAMRWVHNLGAFHAQSLEEQQGTFGRTKPDSVELEDKPPTAHISRVVIEEDGEELEIYRRSVPYGRVGELGLYFIAFSADPSRFHKMLARMFGTTGDGLHDHLVDFTTPVSGSFYFAPSLDALEGILPSD